MSEPSRFDTDPEALAWAREKIQAEIDRADEFAASAALADRANAQMWRMTAGYMRRTLIGGNRCVIAAFDERLPEMVRALDGEVPW